MQASRDENFLYTLQITADGSPTLILENPDASEMTASEAMHNSAGALTESIYIYYENILEASRRGWPCNVLSVGLGLGYNEALTAVSKIRSQVLNSPLIFSFEKNPTIRSQYKSWLTRNAVSEKSFWTEAFDQTLIATAEKFSIDPHTIKKVLIDLYNDKCFRLESDFLDYKSKISGQRFTSILFDAFSKKSTPGLWDEEFLDNVLNDCADKNCILTSYAATGTLNRALAKNGFRNTRRSGFQGKRESTWAERAQETPQTSL